MMEVDWQLLQSVGIYSLAALLCAVGFFLSCLSFSGTWVVFGATLLLSWNRWPAFPGIPTLILFLVLCIGVEVAEALSAAWGVAKRGGSRSAGWGALIGGFVGMAFGGMIPLHIIGNLLGMMLGSFAGAFWVEHARLKKASHAARIATGAVLARVMILLIKIGVALLMSLILAIGLVVSGR